MLRVLKMHEGSVSRRQFLQVAAATGGGLVIGWSPVGRVKGDAPPLAPNGFLRIDRAGRATVISPMIEMGQGTYTALPMLVAEELDVDMSNVSVEHSPPNDKLYGNSFLAGVQVTGNSASVRAFYGPMRQAGATARAMLISAAANSLRVDASTLTTQRGFVVDKAGNLRLAYGDLVDAAAKLPVPADVTLKSPSDFQIIGTPAKRLDAVAKVNGTAVFGIDVKIPEMKVAVVAQSPVFGGKLATFDDARAMKVPGVHKVIRLDDAVSIIADHYWAARKGLEAGAVTFEDGPHASVSTNDVIAALEQASQKPGAVAENKGDVVAAAARATVRVDAVYEAPFLAHATMEPMNCTAHVTQHGCDIWVGTQVPSVAQKVVSDILGLRLEQVRIHNQLLGGGFGRRLECDVIAQAVQIAKQTTHPVKVVWSREDDIQHDWYRPYYYDRVSAALDATGMPVAWTHRIVGPSIMQRFFPLLVTDGVDPDAVDGAIDLPYAIPNTRVEFVREEPPGIPTGFWRGVGPAHNGYVVESFVDELARKANKDPVAYRRAMLAGSPRALHVLDRAAELSGWGSPMADRRGRGVCVQHAFGSYLSQVVEVTVSEAGEVRVDKVVVVVDTGVAINPDTIVAQMHSGIIFGITAVLWGEITISNGRVEQSNFDSYRILRFDEAPLIDVEIVKSSANPGGIGELATSALAPAVLNAIHAATGVRLRRLPVKPDHLKKKA